MTKNLITEIVTILCISLLTAFLVNAARPGGLRVVGDYARYVKETQNPAERTIAAARVLNSEGFVDPLKIELNIAKRLFDKGVLFIDARDATVFASGHIANAKNIPYHDFHDMSKEAKAALLGGFSGDKNAPLVCYCNGGECDVSIDLAYDIARTGYRNVTIYLGGYTEWTKAGYPTRQQKQ